MKDIHCDPHQTGIVFDYDGSQFAWSARGYHLIVNQDVYPIEEEKVPLLVRELVKHWRTFSLEVRVDNLSEWLDRCEICDEEYRVTVSARLDYLASRRVRRACFCGVESYLV